MDLNVTNNLTDQIAALRQAKPLRTSAYKSADKEQEQDESQLPAVVPNAAGKGSKAGTQLLDQRQEDLADGGSRLTSTYQKDDGRTFTKIEEFALTERGSKKTVVQQNPSGSITRYEEVLDREDGGNFRRTQRFQEGAGDVSTQITTDYQVKDPFVLTGGQRPATFALYSPFTSLRGTQLDLQA